MITYAQNHEDIILERAFACVQEGFYVDVGAWDPVLDSVTCHFYQRGWRGVNIEPETDKFLALAGARPRDVNLQVAVGAEAGQAEMFQISGTGLSTLDRNIAGGHAQKDFHATSVEVKLLTLNEIFAEHAPGVVHFLKVDCEGSEAAVLNAFDLTRFRPHIILVEATWPLTRKASREGFEPKLLANGYHMRYFDGLNRFYSAEECPELTDEMFLPPNVFDSYKRNSDVVIQKKLEAALKLARSKLKNAKAELASLRATPNVGGE